MYGSLPAAVLAALLLCFHHTSSCSAQMAGFDATAPIWPKPGGKTTGLCGSGQRLSLRDASLVVIVKKGDAAGAKRSVKRAFAAAAADWGCSTAGGEWPGGTLCSAVSSRMGLLQLACMHLPPHGPTRFPPAPHVHWQALQAPPSFE